jgi:hypothetical protein
MLDDAKRPPAAPVSSCTLCASPRASQARILEHHDRELGSSAPPAGQQKDFACAAPMQVQNGGSE